MAQGIEATREFSYLIMADGRNTPLPLKSTSGKIWLR